MAKLSGLGAKVQVADATGTLQNITNDVTEFSLGTPRGVQDITGVDKSAHERLLLLADMTVALKGVFNPSPGMSHAVFQTVPSTSVNRQTSVAPTANNSTPVLTSNCLYSDYSLNRSASGELTWQTKGDLADGAVPAWA
jgi:hypothetical protein